MMSGLMMIYLQRLSGASHAVPCKSGGEGGGACLAQEQKWPDQGHRCKP